MRLGRTGLGLLAGLGGAALASLPAAAMQFEPTFLDGGDVLVTATGPIFGGDKRRLETLIDSLRARDRVVGFALDSPGGEIDEANEMAGILKETGWPAIVLSGSECASACFLLFAAAPVRYVEGDALVGVHSASEDGNETTYALAATTQMARDAAALGVPAAIIGRMVATEPGRMAWLTPSDLRSLATTILEYGGIDALVAAAPARDPAEVAEAEPFEAGNDLLREEDAARVQQRLSDLGFLDGEADGVWDQASRLALRAFKLANGLPADDIFDREAERLLFSGRAEKADGDVAAVPPGWEPSVYAPPPGASRNPLNPADAVAVQTRLAELGFYPGTAEGAWDRLSRDALRDFAYVNEVEDTGSWNAEVEAALFDGHAVDAEDTIVGLWATSPGFCSGWPDAPDGPVLRLGTWGLEYDGRSCHFDHIERSASRWSAEGTCSWREWTTTRLTFRRFGAGLEATALADGLFRRCGEPAPATSAVKPLRAK